MIRRSAIRASLHPKELQSPQYYAARRRFLHMAVDEIPDHIIRLGKASVTMDNRREAHALLTEVIPRVKDLHHHWFRDMCVMAHAASLHRECVALFDARYRNDTRADDLPVVPIDAVIDSAYEIEDVDKLCGMAKLASTRLQKSSRREIPADFAMWRIVWRLACLASRASFVEPGTLTFKVAKQAEEAATALWLESFSLTHPALFARVQETELQPADNHWDATDAEHSASTATSDGATPRFQELSRDDVSLPTNRAHPTLAHYVPDLDAGHPLRKSFPALFRQIQRIALYSRRGVKVLGESNDAPSTSLNETPSQSDDGEMKFFAFCVRYGLLRIDPQREIEERAMAGGRGGRNDGLTTSNTLAMRDPLSESHLVQFFHYLIQTCRKGQFVDQALLYCNQFRDLQARWKSIAVAENASGAAGGVGAGTLSSGSAMPTSPAVNGSDTEFDDTAQTTNSAAAIPTSFLYQVLLVLQQARSHAEILRLMSPIIEHSPAIAVPLWSIVLLSGGESKNLAVCIRGYEYARDCLKAQKFPVGDSVTAMEYLLQTSLHAIAKCSAPLFVERFLQPCVKDGLLVLNDETTAYMRLQCALHAPNALEELVTIRAWIALRGVPLSTRIASMVFKIFLRVESHEMILFYKEVMQIIAEQQQQQAVLQQNDDRVTREGAEDDTAPTLTYKKLWLEELVVWADRRRYSLSNADRRYIVGELERVFGASFVDAATGKFAKNVLMGLRNQVALLLHDAAHDPLSTFLRKREEAEVHQDHDQGVSSPSAQQAWIPPTPPLSDPKMYSFNKKGGVVDGNDVPVTLAQSTAFAAARCCRRVTDIFLDGMDVSDKDEDDAARVLLARIVAGLQAAPS